MTRPPPAGILGAPPGPALSSPTPAAPEPDAARLASNLDAVRARIAAACAAAGRDPADVQLLAVTKAAPPELTAALRDLGVVDLGENRLPGFDAKLAHFAATGRAARWHYVGHVQRNKARRVVERADVLHAVDSARLLEAVLRHADELGRRPDLYLQVKVTAEDAKGGLDPAELAPVIARAAGAAAAGGPRLLGLMAMAPLCPGADEPARRTAARAAFDAVAALAAEHAAAFPGGRPALSLGMTGDLEEAVAAGSTCVRVGSALFAGLLPPRPTPDQVPHGT